MSDFDPEAEREKLREQFAEDEARKESTERMSQLLLQGATMTDRHCDTCGDPIFRYDGQEFCPTCQAGTNGQQQAAAGDAAAATSAREGDGDGAATSQDAAQSGARSPDSPPATTDGADQQSPAQQPDRADGETEGVADAGELRPGAPGDGGDLGAARDALARTLTRLARQAEAEDDPGRTRTYLAGAKEAAEALNAVRNAER